MYNEYFKFLFWRSKKASEYQRFFCTCWNQICFIKPYKMHMQYCPNVGCILVILEFVTVHVRLDMKSSQVLHTQVYHRMFLEQWNMQKILSNIRQRFSCLLDEWIAKKCKKKFFAVAFSLNPLYPFWDAHRQAG